MHGELSRRHAAVADATARVAWQVGAQVRREVEALEPHSKQRPDIQIVFPGRMLLADVVVSHSLTPGNIANRHPATLTWERRKIKKYAGVSARLGAELLNLSLDTCGVMASDAIKLVQAIGEEGERWSVGTWKSGLIERMLLNSIAVAVQRGNALAMLQGYTRAMGAQAQWEDRVGTD